MDHKFTSGTVLSQTFSVFFANFTAFVLICTVVLSPGLIAQAWSTWVQIYSPSPTASLVSSLLTLVFMVLTPLATAALTYGVFQQVRGKPASIGNCMSTGFQRLLPVIGVSFLAGLLQGLGALLCIVPGFVVMAILAAAVPAAVIERPGVIGALKRSAQLTEGYRWTSFGVVFSIGLLGGLIGMAVGFLTFVSFWLYVILYALVSVVFTGLSATASALLYYHLRKAKEAIDVEEIAAVFD